MRSDPSPITAPRRSSPFTPRLILGLLLIVIGVVFAFDQMGWIDDADDVFKFWPLILVGAGASKLFWPGSSSSRWTGLLLVAIGTLLQLEILGKIEFSIRDYWPLILVVVGARIAWRGLSGEKRRVAPDSTSTVNAVAVMGGVSRTSNAPDFRGGDMVAFMGGCEIDLRQARIADGPAVVDAFAFWGGIEIRVPEDWTVIVRGLPLMGGYEDNTRPPAASDLSEPRQELVVKGFAIMGGVEVKN
ncbi:MAG: cell wall-active antibiotics response protein [bacterium]|nr:cell wall-active antibiotics response protein [bacterium]